MRGKLRQTDGWFVLKEPVRAHPKYPKYTLKQNKKAKPNAYLEQFSVFSSDESNRVFLMSIHSKGEHGVVSENESSSFSDGIIQLERRV